MRVSRRSRVSVPARSTYRRPTTFGRALLGCLPASLVLGLAAVSASVDTSVDGRTVGYAVGAIIVPALLAALVVWLIARRRPAWPFWKLLVVGTAVVLVIQMIIVAGEMST
jgi:hypothetical protein